jgi:hypothetical protein
MIHLSTDYWSRVCSQRSRIKWEEIHDGNMGHCRQWKVKVCYITHDGSVAVWSVGETTSHNRALCSVSLFQVHKYYSTVWIQIWWWGMSTKCNHQVNPILIPVWRLQIFLFYYWSPLSEAFWLPLWSSSQSSWLQIQRSGFDSRRYQIFWEEVCLEGVPLSLVSSTEELLERKSSSSGLEIRCYGRRGSTTLTTRYPSIQQAAVTCLV